MVIVRIWEGLGNQLFQYAYARALQERIQEPVYLDIRHVNRGDLWGEEQGEVTRRLELPHYKISLRCINPCRQKSLSSLWNTGWENQLRRKALHTGLSRWHYAEDAADVAVFDNKLYSPCSNTYVNAHVMNKRYFNEYRNILLREFHLKKSVVLKERLNYLLANKNTVSVHIRLTDCIKAQKVICGRSYYDKAVQYIKEKIENPYFIVFSDDIEMARKCYELPKDVYWIGEDGLQNYEEMYVMSCCKHNIIAASSFSYWGAWLNQNSEKQVVAPGKWFVSSLYEEGWKCI